MIWVSVTGRWAELGESVARCHPAPEPRLSPVERARMSELDVENRRLRLENEFEESSGSYIDQTGSNLHPPAGSKEAEAAVVQRLLAAQSDDQGCACSGLSGECGQRPRLVDRRPGAT